MLPSELNAWVRFNRLDAVRACEQAPLGHRHPDLVAADLLRMIGMLYSVLSTMAPGSDGWRRYVVLILDAISTNERQPLPPAAAFHPPEPTDWAL